MTEPYQRADTIHGLFAWSVRHHPDRTALIHAGRHIGYARLDRLSDHYAHELEARGIGPGDHVGLSLPRTPTTVALLLAVLKRGAAYAAFDPAWPHRRRGELLDRLDARLHLTTPDDTHPWPVPTWAPLPPRGRLHTHTAPAVPGDAPAAVCFTSGSTGTPKGVVLPHHGTARLYDHCAFAPYDSTTVIPQLFPLQWDGPILDLWGPLLCGGTSVLTDDIMQPQLLRTLVADHGVNMAVLPTAVFNVVVDEDVDAFEGIRWVLTGSETVSVEHIRRLLDRFPDIEVSNGYGPVESTALVSAHRITPADLDDPTGIPIGVPLTNSAVHILDGDRPVPPGTTGEICLSGHGLAHGYLDNPDLTEEKFTTLTLDGRPTRVYRTGDLGHRGPDGTLHYGGRNDRQVKIRGHRIEPGEIEQATHRIPGIHRAAVTPVTDAQGRPADLVLHYVTDPDLPVGPDTVRAALTDRLPGYLVPRHIRRLPTLPLTRNGKVDHRALAAHHPAPGNPASGGAGSGGATSGGAAAPGDTPAEDPADTPRTTLDRITHAFARLTPDAAGNSDADFFALGGNSLDAARLANRLTRLLDHPVPVSQIYRTPTPAGLHHWLGTRSPAAPPEQPPADASPAGIPLATGQATFAHATPTTVCLLTWRITGPLDTAALTLALTDVHHRHQTLHARYHPTEPPTATVPDHPAAPDLRHLPATGPDEALAATDRHLRRPLAPATGRNWRAALTRTGPDTHLLGLGIHHIAFDGWSETVLVDDLGTAYRARLDGTPPAWPGPAPTLDLIHREQTAHTPDLAPQRSYWRDRLRTLPKLRLPGVPAAPLAPTGPTHGTEHAMPERLLHAWDTSGRTAFAQHIAVYTEVLHRLTGQTDIGIVTPVAKRGLHHLDRAVTSRINPLVLRTAPRRDPAPVINEALAHQDLPFTETIGELGRARPDVHNLITLPLFLLQDFERAALALAGCSVELAEDRLAQDQGTPLAVEAFRHPAGRLRVTVRTDVLPAAFADTVAELYLATLAAGPEALLGG
ncbi:amino acid adenylation domain-containing protein [Kitasatospora sp. NPDC056446]|uniref:amino acid adenylation domain-containing protein n=1 Tax=Kitasatospora sp. NPDC056446 TaxID=3345819 RepID=UPI00368F06D4